MPLPAGITASLRRFVLACWQDFDNEEVFLRLLALVGASPNELAIAKSMLPLSNTEEMPPSLRRMVTRTMRSSTPEGDSLPRDPLLSVAHEGRSAFEPAINTSTSTAVYKIPSEKHGTRQHAYNIVHMEERIAKGIYRPMILVPFNQHTPMMAVTTVPALPNGTGFHHVAVLWEGGEAWNVR